MSKAICSFSRRFSEVVRDIRSNWDYLGLAANTNEPLWHHRDRYPQVLFHGSILPEGVEVAVVQHADHSYSFQDATSLLTSTRDNHGFVNFLLDTPFQQLFAPYQPKRFCAIHGIWSTKYPDLQKFTICGVSVDGLPHEPPRDIPEDLQRFQVFTTMDAPLCDLSVDINQPQKSLKTLQFITREHSTGCGVTHANIMWHACFQHANYCFRLKKSLRRQQSNRHQQTLHENS